MSFHGRVGGMAAGSCCGCLLVRTPSIRALQRGRRGSGSTGGQKACSCDRQLSSARMEGVQTSRQLQQGPAAIPPTRPWKDIPHRPGGLDPWSGKEEARSFIIISAWIPEMQLHLAYLWKTKQYTFGRSWWKTWDYAAICLL
uniref:Uncharacterized protein n=1 Tax=Sphaerodactylus townsendi TaxID=933632 RepID=A0ACB8EM91_9SAUR